MAISSDLEALRQRIRPLAPETLIDDAAELFLQPACERLLSLPVVEGGRALGTISRFQLNQIFLRRYGRELYGRRPVGDFMNRAPLLVDATQTLEAAAQTVAANITAPMREDFILVDEGRYLGVGVVLDLLRAMERRVAANAEQLSQAYRELQASQSQLVQSEKMASLGQMVAGIAHEINTPLGYVRNNVEMAQQVFAELAGAVAELEELTDLFAREAAEDAITAQLLKAGRRVAELRESRAIDDTRALLQDTMFGADQIREIVASLKSFSRLDQARVERVNLNDCVDQTLVIARHLLKGKVQVVKRYGQLPSVSCSPSQINQVLLNLIGNAAQAIEHDRGAIVISTLADAASVSISVQDNGKGIAPEHLGRIFDPFFTTKAVGQGTGLGLSISYQIVQAHGGTIRVASRVGQGTRFMVTLPLAPAQQAPAPTSIAA